MVGGRYILPAAQELEPLAQGTLSAACGLYSCLNALQLALHPQKLRRAELQALYRHGIRHLSKTRQLNRVLGAGMYQAVWRGLAHELIAHANATYSTTLKLKLTLGPVMAQHRGRSIARIKAEIARGRPILLQVGGLLNHYTVICGYSGDRLTLFDSSELHWIKESCIDIGEDSGRIHWIAREATFSLIDDW